MRESRETHTPASINLLLGQLKGIVAQLESSKITMEAANVDRVETLRAAGRESGCTALQGFADALRNATNAAAMKALQSRGPALSALSAGPQIGVIPSDLSTQKTTKRKASDKDGSSRKAK